jgi:hypothetical protein
MTQARCSWGGRADARESGAHLRRIARLAERALQGEALDARGAQHARVAGPAHAAVRRVARSTLLQRCKSGES